MSKAPLPSWFFAALDAAKRKAGSRAALARALQTRHPTIMDWEEGAVPGVDKFLLLMEYIGGDIERALPGYDLTAEASERMIARLAQAENQIAELQQRLAAIAALAAGPPKNATVSMVVAETPSTYMIAADSGGQQRTPEVQLCDDEQE
jgi:transcriptional regulator with XRE-family HTH domain